MNARLGFLAAGVAVGITMVLLGGDAPLAWKDVLRQPSGWYAGVEAARVAETVILHQRASGGWPKNVDMARVLTGTDRTQLASEPSRTDSTMDNGATTTQLRFLARVHVAQPGEALRGSLVRGFDFLLACFVG